MKTPSGRVASQTRLELVSLVLCGLLSAAAFLVGGSEDGLHAWQGFLLAVPFLLATAWFGWTAALALAPVVLLLVGGRDLLGGEDMQWMALSLLAGVMLLAGLAGQRLNLVWSGSERRAGDSDRRARLLQQAALELNQTRSSKRLFEAALRLLSEILSFSHAELFVPKGDQLQLSTAWRWQPGSDFSIPLGTIIGRAFRTGEPQYVPDTGLDSEFMPAPGAAPTRSELALPVKVGGEVRAVINLEHTDPHAFGNEDHETLRAFTRIIEEVLERLDATVELEEERGDHMFLARLSQQLLRADDAKQAASITLAELLRHVGLDGGVVTKLRQSRLRSLATDGRFPPGLTTRLAEGMEFDGLLKDVWHSKRPTYVEDLLETWEPPAGGPGAEPVRSVALLPIANQQGDVRAMLGLVALGKPRPFSQRERRLIENAAGAFGAALDRATLNRQLFATLDVIRRLPRSDSPAALYQRAAEAAIELITGAEAATVLVRHGDLFRFEAAVGYDLGAIKDGTGPFTLAEELRWYDGPEEDFLRGIGRILKGGAVLNASFASSSDRGPARLEIARVPDIKANILIPITDNDEVVAMLNIDSFSTETAFGPNALRIAEAFAQHIAVIVRQAEQVRNLELNLVTDGLTRLGNREGFQRMLATELTRAERYGSPLNLVMLDLDNFKQVNDRFGHAAGDAALVAVADALRSHLRASDYAFRWGGDEFVLLLPDVQPDEARAAADRFAAIVSAIEIQDFKLAASVGVASYPEDGGDPEALLRRADDLMYYRKQRRQHPIS